MTCPWDDSLDRQVIQSRPMPVEHKGKSHEEHKVKNHVEPKTETKGMNHNGKMKDDPKQLQKSYQRVHGKGHARGYEKGYEQGYGTGYEHGYDHGQGMSSGSMYVDSHSGEYSSRHSEYVKSDPVREYHSVPTVFVYIDGRWY